MSSYMYFSLKYDYVYRLCQMEYKLWQVYQISILRTRFVRSLPRTHVRAHSLWFWKHDTHAPHKQYSALPIYRGLFSPYNPRKTPVTRLLGYGCPPYLFRNSLAEVLPSNLVYCVWYRIIWHRAFYINKIFTVFVLSFVSSKTRSKYNKVQTVSIFLVIYCWPLTCGDRVISV